MALGGYVAALDVILVYYCHLFLSLMALSYWIQQNPV